MPKREVTSTHYQGEWIRTQAFVPDLNGDALLNDSFNSDGTVQLYVYDLSAPTTDIAGATPWQDSLTASTIFEASLASWNLNDVGYSFDHILGADADGEGAGNGATLLAKLEANKTYRLEYICTPDSDVTTAGPIVLIHYAQVLQTLSVTP